MTTKSQNKFQIPTWLIFLFPLILLAGLVIWFANNNPISVSTADLPPIENLDIQRVVLSPGEFELHITNAGPDPIEIAQVLVDEAYWQFTISPSPVLNRLESGVIIISYPWVETEPNEIVIITSSGTTFSTEVEIAAESPEVNADSIFSYGLVGFYIGIIPVGLGLLWFPAMRRLNRKGLGFILALTVGLLVFLFVDTLLELVEVSAGVPEVYQGLPLGLFLALLTWLAITAIGSQNSKTDRSAGDGRKFLALSIALGIGFHNLGEGLVVGAAFALGEAALGSFLVIGFILHNITEGVGIIAPVTKDQPKTSWFLLMLVIAGGPAIVGSIIGGFAFTPLIGVVFLGIGAGAIWQVVYEVTRLMQRDAKKDGAELINWVNVAGFMLGLLIMYLTAFLVKF